LARLLLLGPAREAAGVARDEVEGATVAAVLQAAVGRFGPAFEEVLLVSQVWVNGEPADPTLPVGASDEVAVLPPISGG
jgi:molybdopterin synthase sulfur carrier subunit